MVDYRCIQKVGLWAGSGSPEPTQGIRLQKYGLCNKGSGQLLNSQIFVQLIKFELKCTQQQA